MRYGDKTRWKEYFDQLLTQEFDWDRCNLTKVVLFVNQVKHLRRRSVSSSRGHEEWKQLEDLRGWCVRDAEGAG